MGRAAPEQQQRPLALLDEKCCAGKIQRIRAQAADGLFWRFRRKFRFGRRDILGNIHQHGPWPAGCGNEERLPNGIGQIADIFDDEIMLGYGHGDAVNIDLLKAVRPNLRLGDVVCDGDDGGGIHIGGGEAGEQVGRPRAGSRQADADFAAGPGIAVGRVGGVLLVGHQRMADAAGIFVQRLVDAQDRPARIPEHLAHTLLQQTF